MAQLILGGLVSSTLLDLLVTPTVFLRFGQHLVSHTAAVDPLADR